MDFFSAYFIIGALLLVLICVLLVLSVLISRGGKALRISATVLHIPMLAMLFLAGAEIEVVLLSLLFSAFCYTLAVYVASGRKNK